MSKALLERAAEGFRQLERDFRGAAKHWQTTVYEDFRDEVKLILAATAGRRLHECFPDSGFAREFGLTEEELFPAKPDGTEYGDLSNAKEFIECLGWDVPDLNVCAKLMQTTAYSRSWNRAVEWMGDNRACFRVDWYDHVRRGTALISPSDRLTDLIKLSKGERITVFEEYGTVEEQNRSHVRKLAEVYADACVELANLCDRVPGGTARGGPTAQTKSADGEGNSGTRKPRQRRKKAPHEDSDVVSQIKARLLKHHEYEGGICTCSDPIVVNSFAPALGVSPASVSNFLRDQFQGHKRYKQVCRNQKNLNNAMKMIAGDVRPHILLADAARDVEDDVSE